jgi:hypothetical protein
MLSPELAIYHFQKKAAKRWLSVFEQREKMYRNPVLPLSWSRYSPKGHSTAGQLKVIGD